MEFRRDASMLNVSKQGPQAGEMQKGGSGNRTVLQLGPLQAGLPPLASVPNSWD
jgi:hypothetical protein